MGPKASFVVTGVKVAYGIRAEIKKGREAESSLEISLDPGLAGGVSDVVTFGPKVKHDIKKGTAVGWETGTDGDEDPGFLFAYKVQRVTVKKTKDEEKKVAASRAEHASGAVLGTETPVAEEPDRLEIDTGDAEPTDDNGVLVKAGDKSENLLLVGP